ncbi:M28 family peptidase [Brachybacterium sacelli]|uniref:Vacuolar membrane protease n=1 Tax=Brachybacterium sacelli TaxID=173364 RepID=A0ABS4X769_9MICO|nr:M28 family peptidase [Brachybacterium sacelli]MBP2384196.1 hypothetical protein [Brachybacterium sacelli]
MTTQLGRNAPNGPAAGDPTEPTDPTDDGAREPGPRRRGRGLLRWQVPALLAVLLLVAGLGFASRGVTEPRGTDAPEHVFSAARATAATSQIVDEPHPVGSDANAEAHADLAEQLAGLGFETTSQESLGMRAVGDQGTAGYTDNLLATRPGTDPTGTIVLATHIDSVPNAPGAADAGVGLSVILETVRALGPEAQRNDLVILLVDGEERGLLGAQAHLDARAGELAEPVVVLNHEARGVSGRPLVTRTSGPMHAVLGSMPHPEFESFCDALFGMMPNDTDFTVYRAGGWWGMDMAIIDDAWAYHSPQDDAEHLDEGTLQHYGEMTLALTRDLTARDLTALQSRTDEEPVQTTAPWGIVKLPPPLVTAAGVLAPLAVLAAVLVLRRRGELTLRGTALGALTGLIALPLSAAAAVMAWQTAAGASPQMLSQTTGEPVRAELFLLADVLAGAVAVTLCWVLARFLISRTALLSGAALVTTALLAALAVSSPQLGSSMIPPAVIAAVGFLLTTVLPPGVGLAVRALTLLPTGWMLGTQVSSLMEFGIASSSGGLAGTVLVGLAAAAPLLRDGRAAGHCRARRARRLLVPVLAAVLTAAALVGGTALSLAAPEPVQEGVLAQVDGRSGETTWDVSGTTEWGRALDGTRATSDLPPPSVETTPGAEPQEVEIVLASPREAAQFELSLDEGALREVRLDGEPLEAEEPTTALQIVGVPQDQEVTVTATVPDGAELTVLETTYDPSLADGWVEPGPEVSLMQPRLRIAVTEGV